VYTSGVDWGGERKQPTHAESAFAEALNALWPGLIYWLHQDADGIPWLLVSLDFPGNDVVRDTLRLDFDATGIKGGWSPAFVNWDSGVRAGLAEIDTAGPDGIEETGTQASPAELAQRAANWFQHHSTTWHDSERNARWRPAGK